MISLKIPLVIFQCSSCSAGLVAFAGVATFAPSPALAPLALLLLLLFLLLLLLLLPLLFLLLVQLLLLLQASPIKEVMPGRPQEALNNSPGQRTSGVPELRQHGNGKRGQQEREEARGLRIKSRGSERKQVAWCKKL